MTSNQHRRGGFMAPSLDCIFPLGYFILFFFLTLHMLLHALHISNIFPGTQPKDPNHDSILKVP